MSTAASQQGPPEVAEVKMRLALLGCDDDMLRLVRAAIGRDDIQVPKACLVARHESALRALCPDLQVVSHWESLLLDEHLTAVVVSRRHGEPWREDALRKMTQTGTSMLLIHPVCEPILALELDMIARDSRAVLATYCPGQSHPALDELRRLVDQGDEASIGRAEQLVFEINPQSRDQLGTLDQLARHAMLVREIVGTVGSVSAMAGQPDDGSLKNLAVSMSCGRSVVARWSAGPLDAQLGARLTLLGSRGQVRLDMVEDESRWELLVTNNSETRRQPMAWDGPSAAFDKLNSALAGGPTSPAWTDSCFALEIADAAVRSARRGRAVTLHEEVISEEGAFKGLMAISSCGILLLALVVLVVGTVVEGFRLPRSGVPRTSTILENAQAANQAGRPTGINTDANRPVSRPGRRSILVRLWPVYPLAIFLLFQLLRLAARPAPPSSTTV